eukprot:TRINITY_DN13113_c0_g1_i1.p1 TRINITY_DN13113_c0_g1~~TRINITY_DN13113_c0_g1_i1.p1  ORF type:complete len:275 (+),score=112.44 TRINITY_DN13113_c0_g1_i1:58-825(+)
MDLLVERDGREAKQVTILRGPLVTVGYLKSELQEQLGLPLDYAAWELLHNGAVLADDLATLDDAGFGATRDKVCIRPPKREDALQILRDTNVDAITPGSVDAALDASAPEQVRLMLKATTHPKQLLHDALFRACKGGHADRVRALVSLGVDVNSATDDVAEVPALSYAASHGAGEVCMKLLAHHATPSKKCRRGRTPFLYAMDAGLEDVCVELLRRGAEDIRCKAYMEHAQQAGLYAVVEEFAKIHPLRAPADRF